MSNLPVYPIGIVAEMLDVHPETIRVWEKHGVVHPGRRSGRRFYSDDDLKRLQFIRRLTNDGLNIPAIRHYLQLYPCWQLDGCPHCMHRTTDYGCTKPCWKEEGAYCLVSGNDDLCRNCDYREHEMHRNDEAMNEQT